MSDGVSATPPAADSDAHGRRAASELIAEGVLDADLCALLWLLIEAGVPLVVATTNAPKAAEEVRSALSGLVANQLVTADGALAGGVLRGDSLEDVLRLNGANLDDGVPDAARELGVVLVLGQANPGDQVRVLRAHYMRPIERDGAGHIQRRPPALLSAWDEDAGRLDHFHWGISNELARRADREPGEFEVVHRRRTRLLDGLASARVFDQDDLRRHIDHAALVEAGATGSSQVDAPN